MSLSDNARSMKGLQLKYVIGGVAGVGAVFVSLAVVWKGFDQIRPGEAHVLPAAASAPVEAIVPPSPEPEPMPEAGGQEPVFAQVEPVQPDVRANNASALIANWRRQTPDDPLLHLYESALAPPPAPHVYKPGHDAEMNVLMDQLCDRESDAVRLADFFMAIMLDPSRDIVQRDYALQHLRRVSRILVDTGGPGSGEDRAAAAERACQAMIETVSESTCCLAGTALLALEEFTGKTPAAAADVVSRLAVERAGDVQADAGIRLTALLVGAKLQNPAVLPLAWQILETTSDQGLRLTAITLIGALGDMYTMERLDRLKANADETEKHALDAAIRKIAGRKT